jgi:hypothetical protein
MAHEKSTQTYSSNTFYCSNLNPSTSILSCNISSAASLSVQITMFLAQYEIHIFVIALLRTCRTATSHSRFRFMGYQKEIYFSLVNK